MKNSKIVKRLCVAFGLLVLSNVALAQLSCTPSAPRTDPGTGFAAFGEREQLLARGGNSGPAWEWALGTDTDASGQLVKASLDWVSGTAYGWTLTYTGAGSATVELRDGGTLLFTQTFGSGMDSGNALHFQVSTNPSIGLSTTIAATVTSIAGHTVSEGLSQTGNNTDAQQNLYIFFPGMAGGFTAQGTVTLTYASLPTGSRINFIARAGNINCVSTNQPPTVSITAPTNGQQFDDTAPITVTADAQDSDGTVSQVEFFADGNPIGTATASPFTIQWANAAAGSYTLTARATDNDNAQTTSDPVSVTVNHVVQVFFIHSDHLNTPRTITNQTGQLVWTWANDDPFGNNAPNENPSGLGNFNCNLRLPGQYFDQETSNRYNYFRDYDPAIGRYIESDPIGLAGGINTYLYVGANPTSFSDPRGLDSPLLYVGSTYAWPSLPRPYDPTFGPSAANCAQYDPGSVASAVCLGTPSNPGMNCSRKCLQTTYPGNNSTFLQTAYWLVPQHPICWVECRLDPFDLCPGTTK